MSSSRIKLMGSITWMTETEESQTFHQEEDKSSPLVHGDDSTLFMGQKERRRSSDTKSQLGDYLNLQTNSAILKLIAKTGDSKVLFSDEVVKVNKRLKMQNRVLLITDTAIYNLNVGNFKVKRRIALQNLGSVSLSQLTDNFFAMCIPSEYDYLMVSNKKIEIVQVLMDAFKTLTGNALIVNFSNSFEYRIDEKSVREIRFTNVDGGVSTQVFAKKD
ncbi:putative myosin heavy chain IB [Blattamonas nauphoetae]|uniref:Myosin heavy chain IB n=1 Tax=Blattamonas nauphoetae TaxID=2049346 RepID=A0ABQ9XRI4_9EUKA|nr:putative myosin heavy chain IB [Blattamonas nauphoetae]